MYEAHFPNQAHSYIFSATSGVVFLGTPHRGSQWANRLAIAQLGVSLFQSQAELVRLLRAKSEDLATISERFNSIWGTKPVLSCCERRRMLGVGMVRSLFGSKHHNLILVIDCTTRTCNDQLYSRNNSRCRCGSSWNLKALVPRYGRISCAS